MQTNYTLFERQHKTGHLIDSARQVRIGHLNIRDVEICPIPENDITRKACIRHAETMSPKKMQLQEEGRK